MNLTLLLVDIQHVLQAAVVAFALLAFMAAVALFWDSL